MHLFIYVIKVQHMKLVKIKNEISTTEAIASDDCGICHLW